MPAEARVPGPTDRDAGIDRFVARGSGPRGSPKEAQRREARLPERKPNRRPRLRIGAPEKPRTQKALGRVAGQFEGAREGKARRSDLESCASQKTTEFSYFSCSFRFTLGCAVWCLTTAETVDFKLSANKVYK